MSPDARRQRYFSLETVGMLERILVKFGFRQKRHLLGGMEADVVRFLVREFQNGVSNEKNLEAALITHDFVGANASRGPGQIVFEGRRRECPEGL